jgi:cobalamin biosynthesis Mg chelatase CobN
MFGSRHQGYAWNRSVFSLLSVLALLAFACLPVAASADSSGVEYGNETPSAYGSHKSTPTVVGGGDDGSKAQSSNVAGGAGGGGGSGSGGSSGGDAGTGAGSGPDGGKAGNGSTNPQHANGGKDAAGKLALQEAEPQGSQNSEDDGGSSPVVPILIVLALLAAVSAGIVIMRQRRQPDSPATPKAG